MNNLDKNGRSETKLVTKLDKKLWPSRTNIVPKWEEIMIYSDKKCDQVENKNCDQLENKNCD